MAADCFEYEFEIMIFIAELIWHIYEYTSHAYPLLIFVFHELRIKSKISIKTIASCLLIIYEYSELKASIMSLSAFCL